MVTYLPYINLALLPSIIWLAWFLRKDSHPEPNSQVVRIFLWGAAATLPALLLELGLAKILDVWALPLFLSSFLTIFVGVALVEEIFKYLVIHLKVLRSPEFDEPIDGMLYMIIAALGFAAVENLLLFFKPGIFVEPFDPLLLSLVRFLGATFLHALSSGLVGFFLALSLFHQKNHLPYLSLGLVLATLWHGFYNFAIIEIRGPLKFFVLLAAILALALFVSWGLKRLKNIKSVCEI